MANAPGKTFKGTLPSFKTAEVAPEPLSVPEDFDISYVLKSFPKGTAAWPSGLRVQHLLDAAAITLPTSIYSLLRGVINLLASGKAPREVSIFLAGGSLTALNKLNRLYAKFNLRTRTYVTRNCFQQIIIF